MSAISTVTSAIGDPMSLVTVPETVPVSISGFLFSSSLQDVKAIPIRTAASAIAPRVFSVFILLEYYYCLNIPL